MYCHGMCHPSVIEQLLTRISLEHMEAIGSGTAPYIAVEGSNSACMGFYGSPEPYVLHTLTDDPYPIPLLSLIGNKHQ